MGLPVGQTSAAPFDPAVVVSAYPAPALPAPCPTVQAVPVAASASPASVPDVSMRLAIANVRAKRAAVATVMNLVIVNMVCIAVWFSLSHGQDTYFWPKWVLCGSAAFAYVPVSRWVVASCVRDVFSRLGEVYRKPWVLIYTFSGLILIPLCYFSTWFVYE